VIAELLRRRGTALFLGVIALAASAGCSEGSGPGNGSGAVQAAPQASDAACLRAMAGLPATVMGRTRTPIGVAGAASWGEPPIVLRCGLPAAAPTTLPCLSVNGSDWVVDADHDPIVFTSYGTAPALELRVPARYGRDAAVGAVTDVASLSLGLPSSGHRCVGAGDVSSPDP
jgi:hypothetical protein